MSGERQMSGQELVWSATKTLTVPEGWRVIALRPEIWGPAVHAQVTDPAGQSLSAEVSELEAVEEVAATIQDLINALAERAAIPGTAPNGSSSEGAF